jgi:hypothetical protein
MSAMRIGVCLSSRRRVSALVVSVPFVAQQARECACRQVCELASELERVGRSARRPTQNIADSGALKSRRNSLIPH